MQILNINLTKLSIICSIASLISLHACDKESSPLIDADEWRLTWSDEFDGVVGQSVDPAKWTFDIGRGGNGWGNNEMQYYTDRASNVSLDGDGNLVLTARYEAFNGANFTSARIKTQGLFSQQYGRIEARIKTPYGAGIWPAFWMLGNDITSVSWPQCGEIDIMELKGQQPTVAHGSLHGPGYSGGAAITKSYTLPNGRFDNSFHVFGVMWDENKIDFYIDDVLYNSVARDRVGSNQWVFDDEFFIILNIAVGGNFVGLPTLQTVFPQMMTIDYVRAYQKI